MAAHRLERCSTVDEVGETVSLMAVELLEATRVAFCRIEQDTCRIVVIEPPLPEAEQIERLQRSYRADERPGLRALIRDRESWVAHAFDVEGNPTVPGDPDAGDAVEIGSIRRAGYGTGLASPIVVNGAVWGQVFAVRAPGAGLFGVDDVAAAEVLAALAASAIARVDLDAQVRHLVADDPLTGLANRRAVDTAAESALESGSEVCIVMCDVDGLKRVNDHLGHEAGDDLLRTVADVLRRVSDRLPGSTAARIGGDEFCLVTVGHRRAAVAEVLTTTIADYPLPHGAAISWGVATTALSGATSARNLFRYADVAQYKAKRARARARKATVPVLADPAVTAERVVVSASAAIAQAKPGVLPRLTALAAASTETLGGANWAVYMQRDGDDAAVSRGGAPGDIEREQITLRVAYGTWAVEIGASTTAATDAPVTTALHALLAIAIDGAS